MIINNLRFIGNSFILAVFTLLVIYGTLGQIWYSGIYITILIFAFLAGIALRDIFHTQQIFPNQYRHDAIVRLIHPDMPTVRFWSGGEDSLVQMMWEGGELPERITHSAIRHPTGLVFAGESPARHHHVIKVMDQVDMAGIDNTMEQGFLTNKGRYVNRYEAMCIAKRQGQIRYSGVDIEELSSESLW